MIVQGHGRGPVPLGRIALAVGLGLAALAPPAPAPAGPGGLGGASEFTQRLNNVELGVIAGIESRILDTEAASLLKQTRQLETELSAYRIMQRNVRNLPQQHLRDAARSITRLRGIAHEAEAVVGSGQALDRFLRTEKIEDPLFERDGLDRARIAERYDDWQGQWRSSLEASLRASGATFDDVESEARTVDLITRRFGTEEGQQQVLQGANQLAASMTRQLGGLRAITASQVEQNGIAWGRVMADMDRREAAEREHAVEVRETLEAFDAQPEGRTIEEIFLE